MATPPPRTSARPVRSRRRRRLEPVAGLHTPPGYHGGGGHTPSSRWLQLLHHELTFAAGDPDALGGGRDDGPGRGGTRRRLREAPPELPGRAVLQRIRAGRGVESAHLAVDG